MRRTGIDLDFVLNSSALQFPCEGRDIIHGHEGVCPTMCNDDRRRIGRIGLTFRRGEGAMERRVPRDAFCFARAIVAVSKSRKKYESAEKAQYAGVPVYNGLTDEYHPTQMLADVLTMREHSDKPISEIKYAYVGDTRSNMGHSLMIVGALMGMDVRICGPKSLWPAEEYR